MHLAAFYDFLGPLKLLYLMDGFQNNSAQMFSPDEQKCHFIHSFW